MIQCRRRDVELPLIYRGTAITRINLARSLGSFESDALVHRC